jgi:hypothetical protein
MKRDQRVRSLSRQRQAFLAELAESVAEESSPCGERVDLASIARAHGITLSWNDYGGCFDGLLQCRNGRFHLFCHLEEGRDRGDGRARFTVAHELAHFFIPEHRRALTAEAVSAHPSFSGSLYSDGGVEAEADYFASRLLLPEKRFRKALAEHGDSLRSLVDVAQVFGASVEATVRRAVELPGSLAAMVMFRPDATVWSRVPPGLESIGLKRIKVARPDAHPGAATWQARHAPDGGRVFQTMTSGRHWFRFVEPGSPADQVLQEEAFRSRYCLLTLLTLKDAIDGAHFRGGPLQQSF